MQADESCGFAVYVCAKASGMLLKVASTVWPARAAMNGAAQHVACAYAAHRRCLHGVTIADRHDR